MARQNSEFERLSTKEGFNRSLRHFKAVSGIIKDVNNYENLGDILSEMLSEKVIEKPQVTPIIHAILVDKFNYAFVSKNLSVDIDTPEAISDIALEWNAVDMVLLYFHPELGVIPINPKNKSHLENIDKLKKNELVTVYAGTFAEEPKSRKVLQQALDKMVEMLSGKKVRSTPTLKKGDFSYEAPELENIEEKEESQTKEHTQKKEAPKSTGKVRVTPLYSVAVTNELFHNGNVEAWKRIINAYKSNYTSSEVYIYYEGEAIHDINTLFKWGKVKHGSSINFCVAGTEIKDVAKLQRYLRQGASPQFEDFLKYPVNKILDLF